MDTQILISLNDKVSCKERTHKQVQASLHSVLSSPSN